MDRMEPLKYVNYYKRTLVDGCLHNLRADHELRLVVRDSFRPAAYVTGAFDTRDVAGGYNRLRLEGVFGEARLEVIVAAANRLDLPVYGAQGLADFLADGETTPQDKAAVMRELNHVRAVGARDILLYSLKGRYVWVFVGITPTGEEECRLDGLRLEFPKESFLRYFPEIYRQNDFFERYIAIFQSLYLDLERRVDELPRLLDYEAAAGEQLAQLADWLGLDDVGDLFSDLQIREMIRRLDLFQGGKGTRAALAEILRLATGKYPRIVEFFQWDTLSAPQERRARLGQLYGGSPGCFCVMIDAVDGRELPPPARLDRLIRRYSPIGTTHKLVLLRRTSNTDLHCYLDINSVLATPESASVGAVTLNNHITVG